MSTLPTKDPADRPDAARDRRTPGWVKVLGVIVLMLLAAFVVSRLLGIQHGPDLHSWLLAPDLAVVASFSAA
jgi:hypothetical protein